ncbi:MAG: hypothetical protein LBK25_05395 [Treponema sp.]|nr:hypothetical protein [Treponema sp.]
MWCQGCQTCRGSVTRRDAVSERKEQRTRRQCQRRGNLAREVVMVSDVGLRPVFLCSLLIINCSLLFRLPLLIPLY